MSVSGLSDLRTELHYRRRAVVERMFDLRHRVDTRGRFEPDDVEDAAAVDAHGYQAVLRQPFAELIRASGVVPSGHAFIDLGSGKGRALLFALDAGFREVLGVELSSALADVARRNLCSYRGGRFADAAASVVTGDATEFEIPATPAVVFLFNPFGEAPTRAVADRIDALTAVRYEPLVVIYANPVHDQIFAGRPERFRLVRRRVPERGLSSTIYRVLADPV